MAKLSPELVKKIREQVSSGVSKYEVAKTSEIPYNTVLYHTQDFPNAREGNRRLGDRAMRIIQKLMKDGFFVPEAKIVDNSCCRNLRKHLPLLRKISVNKIVIYYLEDRKNDALRGFLDMYGNRVVEYRDLTELARLFGIKLSGKEKVTFLSKNAIDRLIKPEKGQRKKPCQIAYNRKISDFLSRNVFSELLRLGRQSQT
jgi:hypothetical protein